MLTENHLKYEFKDIRKRLDCKKIELKESKEKEEIGMKIKSVSQENVNRRNCE